MNRVPPTGVELRDALAAYRQPAGGWRCPVGGCGALLRVLDRTYPAQIAGCTHGHALTRLARQAGDAGYLHRSAA